MKRIIRIIFLIFFLVVLFVAWKVMGPSTENPDGKYLFIKTGSSYQYVRTELVSKGVLPGSFWFDKVARFLHYDKSIKPGRYKIEKGTSILSLVRTLKSGRQSPVNLVITKLRTKEDLARKIGDNFEPDSALVSAFLNNNDTLSRYQLDSNSVMTAILPNTYTLQWNTPMSRIFKRLYAEQQKFWNPTRKEKAASLHLSQKEVYILASIVEEETNADADKGNIASVYINRMNGGMKLAADPTVKFALHNFTLRRILNVHTHAVSPYNTYLVNGLPPGPICTPSSKTIDAVLNAPATNYLYFVARPDRSGLSSFAQSYEEHRKNATVYQRWLDSLFTARKLNLDGSKPTN